MNPDWMYEIEPDWEVLVALHGVEKAQGILDAWRAEKAARDGKKLREWQARKLDSRGD